MNLTMDVSKQSVENVIVHHIETLYSVALGLTRCGAKAEILVQDTARRALQDPRFVKAPYPKAALLTLLRTTFLESGSPANRSRLASLAVN